ncbi:NmrA-like family protein [Xylaria bambusicola]|uniref:NmrA-like family protein n=1 Tax=Xylaria bambusicola TaxID=326684 RepID=UPI002007B8BF|nr:NmrA-like family protein [Xylaria bambusicola]KAI0508472.1 NmrA-like family protein [Xylaria bambusicola]
MAQFKNVLIIGASGFFGNLVLEALQKDSDYTLTLLQRTSSKTRLPEHLNILTIADSYPIEELTSAFEGQDLIINCITTLSVKDQYRMVDAAIAAGVRRYVASEYGLNNMNPKAQALNNVFADKGKVQSYLRAKGDEGQIEWMSISCGIWIKWGMAHDFVGMHVRERRFVFWDDGEGLFSCTTEENTAAGLVSALKVPEETKNKNLFLSDFAINQRQLFDAIERIQGIKYQIETIDSEKLIAEKKEAEKQGDGSATMALIETGFVTGKFGGHLEKEGVIMNQKLGLPERILDEVVADALKSLGVL